MTDDFWKDILGIFIAAVSSFNAVTVWSIRDLVKKHEQSLYGANGDNGMQQEIKAIRQRNHEQISTNTATEMRLSVLEQDRPPHHLPHHGAA